MQISHTSFAQQQSSRQLFLCFDGCCWGAISLAKFQAEDPAHPDGAPVVARRGQAQQLRRRDHGLRDTGVQTPRCETLAQVFVSRPAAVTVAPVGDDAPPVVGAGIAGAGRVAEGGVAFPVVLAFLGR